MARPTPVLGLPQVAEFRGEELPVQTTSELLPSQKVANEAEGPSKPSVVERGRGRWEL